MDTRPSLLDDPVLGITRDGNRTTATLPDVLAALGAGHDLEFTALRAHQQHGWYAFLVQLGALVVHRSGEPGLDRTAEAWRQALLDLAAEDASSGEDAWRLVVDDLSRPAFLQTPVPEGTLDLYKRSTLKPDALDVLITSKNHDVKQQQIREPRPEHWIYALVTLQTMEGFLGRGNYGIARMNGGFASRPALAAAPSLRWSDRFQRDVKVWLETRPRLAGEPYGYPDTGGHALLWTLPWDGKQGRAVPSCDPFFIEVCRRIRLVKPPEGRLEARMAPTAEAFLDAGQRRGDTGDVWTPLGQGKDGVSALTVGGSGFSYRLLTSVLFSGDYRPGPALETRFDDGPEPVLLAQVLVRGQGKTDGFHQRLLRVPERIKKTLMTPVSRDALGKLAEDRVDRVATAERKVLHPALCVLLQGDPDKLNLRDDRTRRWLDRLDKNVDGIFFDDLWADADRDPDEANRRWDRRLFELAKRELDDAITSAPVPLAVQDRAVARAGFIFHALVRKKLPGALKDKSQEEETS